MSRPQPYRVVRNVAVSGARAKVEYKKSHRILCECFWASNGLAFKRLGQQSSISVGGISVKNDVVGAYCLTLTGHYTCCTVILDKNLLYIALSLDRYALFLHQGF